MVSCPKAVQERAAYVSWENAEDGFYVGVALSGT